MDWIIKRLPFGTRVSDQVKKCAKLFDSYEIGVRFLDLVFAEFAKLERSYGREPCPDGDILFLNECGVNDIQKKKYTDSSLRVDGYFYALAKLTMYCQESGISSKPLEKFKESILELLSSEFENSKGKRPNLITKDPAMVKQLNIKKHLTRMTIDSIAKFRTFLILSKLTLQSDFYINNQRTITWDALISEVERFEGSLTEYFDTYKIYMDGFKEFPLDMAGMAKLIRLMPMKGTKGSPIQLYYKICCEIHVKPRPFFDHMTPIFTDHVRFHYYDIDQIFETFKWLKISEKLLSEYFSIYVNNALSEDAWKIFLKLQSLPKTENIPTSIIGTVSNKLVTYSPGMFYYLMKSTENTVSSISEDLKKDFVGTLSQVFYYYIHATKDLPFAWSHLKPDEWKELLNIGLQLRQGNENELNCLAFLIRHAIFRIDPTCITHIQKLKALMQNVKSLNAQFCNSENAKNIIEDTWLTDFVAHHVDIWLKLDREIYAELCSNYQDNLWTCYIWNKITQLSLQSFFKNDPIGVLIKLNQWIEKVNQHIFNKANYFTIVLVQQVFAIELEKNSMMILILPNISNLLNYVICMKQHVTNESLQNRIERFFSYSINYVISLVELRSQYSSYSKLSMTSNIVCVISLVDLNEILSRVDQNHYRFPATDQIIDEIVGLPRPSDIPTELNNGREDFVRRMCETIIQWYAWFDRFIDIFQNVLEWLKNYNCPNASQLLKDLLTIHENHRLSVIDAKKIIETTIKSLISVKELSRLCYSLNCLIPFQIVDPAVLSNQDNSQSLIKELKRIQVNNTFTVQSKNKGEHVINIDERQDIEWSIASENNPTNVRIEFKTVGVIERRECLYQRDGVPLHRNILRGRFYSHQQGKLVIIVENQHHYEPQSIWYRVKYANLSPCHLFNGIFDISYNKLPEEHSARITFDIINALLGRAYGYIDRLLNGDLTLATMEDLKSVFHDKNINIREEVKKLFASRINRNNGVGDENSINQVCLWLQTYQYYSHITTITSCIEKFDLVPAQNDREIIGRLRQLTTEANCSLRDIADTYQILQERFRRLTHQHLQLIKTAVECSPVVLMMKKSGLYSEGGQRRFQELRDNLTMQFQLQERNNMILNSWIVTYRLIKPFTEQAKDFDSFVEALASLPPLEESSLNHIKIVNDNLQIVTLWLNAEESNVLDNALITMEHLYRNSTTRIYLRRLIGEPSYYQISYSIERIRNIDENEENDGDNLDQLNPNAAQTSIKCMMSMSDIEDHKRQLTFCNVDTQQNMINRKPLLKGQLKLLKTVEQIYHTLTALEFSGHPDYQFRDENYVLSVRRDTIRGVQNQRSTHVYARLTEEIRQKVENLEKIHCDLIMDQTVWMKSLERYRQTCPVLQLFTNREIMILIILLRKTNKVRIELLKRFFGLKDSNDRHEERELTLRSVGHYLSSLRLKEANLTNDKLTQLYTDFQVDDFEDATGSLKKLSQFLEAVFQENPQVYPKVKPLERRKQYLVKTKQNRLETHKNSPVNQLDMQTCCTLLSLFDDQLPAAYQILWCTNTTLENIQLFFSRIRTFTTMTFAVMQIDQAEHRIRDIIFSQQSQLVRDKIPHGRVFYFSNEAKEDRQGLEDYNVSAANQNPQKVSKDIEDRFRRRNLLLQTLRVVYGESGIGKTHFVNHRYGNENLTCFSINDQLNISLMIDFFLRYDIAMRNRQPTVFLNISIHAPFQELNRTLLSLLLCGCLNDPDTGLVFSLPQDQSWQFIVEVPYSKSSGINVRENIDLILPILSIIPTLSFDEVSNKNYLLNIGQEEELIARFYKAFVDRSIDRWAVPVRGGTDISVTFPQIDDSDESRALIYNCINKFAQELPENKIYQLSFIKFLYRRVRFFVGPFFIWNQTIEKLGSVALRQMIDESRILTQIHFRDHRYPRNYLVYDPGFSLQLLHSDWNLVPTDIKALFSNKDPMFSPAFKTKDYFAMCLAWLIDIQYDDLIDVTKQMKFILTENFVYKLFHVHERKLTKLPLIIEGDTGVGKTFLLKFYSQLLQCRKITRLNEVDVDLETVESSTYRVSPQIIENSNKFILKIIDQYVEANPNFLNAFLEEIQGKITEPENDDEIEIEDMQFAALPMENEQPNMERKPVEENLLVVIKSSLRESNYEKSKLYLLWRTILKVSSSKHSEYLSHLIEEMHNYVNREFIEYPVLQASRKLQELLQITNSPSMDVSMRIFREYLINSRVQPLFYRLLLHPSITEEQVMEFMDPIVFLARQLPNVEIVVFFDEVNTSSCLGLFKEMFMDGTIHGKRISKNIFFTAAINPLIKAEKNTNKIHRTDFNVHQLPEALQDLVVGYGCLQSRTLADYISRKIASFQLRSGQDSTKNNVLDSYIQTTLADTILNAQDFCEKYLGRNTVSQREIQRCFNLIEFFWELRYEEDLQKDPKYFRPNPERCIALAIALIYYFRLPTEEDNRRRNDHETPTREKLASVIKETIHNFEYLVEKELVRFVNLENFVIPEAVAINQAIREHVFSIVVSVVTRTPLCIIGTPGQSKTLSFQIVLQNLQGPQLSPKAFCKRLPAIDPFFCLGSKYTRSEDIAAVFERAIKREQQYEQNRIKTRCVVFLDEASLPSEQKMVLKVLHPYLDECKVSFVSVANEAFDAANANRMICIYRSTPSHEDQKILVYGCLGLSNNSFSVSSDDRLEKLVVGLCRSYRSVLDDQEIPHIFHDRDFIYMLRQLRFTLSSREQDRIPLITPNILLEALEDNFNGIKSQQFDRLVDIFAETIGETCPEFHEMKHLRRNQRTDILKLLERSIKLKSKRRRLYGRYKLIIDESEDESAIRLLYESGIFDVDQNRPIIYRMSDLNEDIGNELKNVEILSEIKLSMEIGQTILMINTGRIHGSLYDVFNQNFSIMATDDSRKIFSKVAIGPKTMDVVVHEDFQCIVHVKRSEFQDIPAPFLSRFQKYSLSISNFYETQLSKIPVASKLLLDETESRVRDFIQYFGKEYFNGFTEETLKSILLSMIQRVDENECTLKNLDENFSQLTIASKSFVDCKSNDEKIRLSSYVVSKLIQLSSPEALLVKWRSTVNEFMLNLREEYFNRQEHLDFRNFLSLFASNSTSTKSRSNNNVKSMNIVRKLILYTRTSSFITTLHTESRLNSSRETKLPPSTRLLPENVQILNLVC